MDKVYLFVTVVLFLAMFCSLIRAGLGPTWFDRLLAVNAFTTKTVLLIAIYFFATGYPEYIDIALLYALISYAGTLAVARYIGQQVEDPVQSNEASENP